MKTDLWRHLVQWEVRHAVRGSTFWLMAALMAAIPALLANPMSDWVGASGPDAPQLDVGTLVFAETLLLSVLVSLWTVFSVKRQVAADVSDDWLLVLTYRQSLVSRYLAGGLVGLLLLLPGILGVMLVGTATGADLTNLLGAQVLVAAGVLQAVAMASIIVAAADFLVAATPVVLFVLVVLDALWCLIPVAGFCWPAAAFARDPLSGSWLMYALFSLPVCLGALAVGWWKAEDFWAYLKMAHRKRQEASLGEVRGAVESAEAPKRGVNRATVTRNRARLLARGVDPLLAHDMARYPWWFQRFEVGPNFWLQTAVGGLLVWYWMWLSEQQHVHTGIYFVFFGFWMASAAVVLRALSSGANIVVQEKEERTLPHLLLTPLGARQIVAMKLRVVLYQPLPPLVVLTAASLVFRLPAGQLVGLWVIALAAAVSGVLASMVAPTRLVAMVLAGRLGAGVLALNDRLGAAVVA
ncbi:MAG: hypothetical protein HYU66_18200, partial [Armatimonadetes bacterium]|nr:hypothetical protein [Armatimonadota bacterium]